MAANKKRASARFLFLNEKITARMTIRNRRYC